MIETWTIVDPGLGGASTGHHYTEAKAIADELRLRGIGLKILAYQDTPASKFPTADVLPIFSLFSYTRTDGSTSDNISTHNTCFERDIGKVDQSLFNNSLIFFPTLRERHLRGLMRWLGKFTDDTRPVVALVLTELSVPPDPLIATMYRNLWTTCPDPIKKRIVLCARTPKSVDQFYKILGLRPFLLPSPLGVPAHCLDNKSTLTESWDETMVVSFMGNARQSKGCAIIPHIVQQCRNLDVRFFIQVKPDAAFAFDMSAIRAVGKFPNVQIHEGYLEQADYYGVIKRSVTLLAYQPQAYRWQSSGVFIEASSLGAPMIVSDGTWMSEEVRAAQNGLVFHEYTPDAIAHCIAEAKTHLPELRANAAVYAKKFRAENGPDRCVDEVLQLARKSS